MVQGPEGLQAARTATEIFFGAEIRDLNDVSLLQIFADVPSKRLSRERLLAENLTVVDAFVEVGLANSKGDARRAIEQGGAYVNNRRIAQSDARLRRTDLASETIVVLRRGKKNYGLLRFE
jgi:tyrosyl-tRNA synthetase